jgi:hypothetical protein
MTPKEHAIHLLAQGIPTAQVAAACGVSEAYISQLKADPDTRQEIAEKQAASSIEDITFDTSLDAAEGLALDKIQRALPFANLGQAIAAFRILNGAKRKADPVQQVDNSVNVTVNLTLPAAALPRYITNAQNEIVEVEGKTMLSATAKTLDTILADKAGKAIQGSQLGAAQRAAAVLDRLSTPRSLIPQAPARRSPLPLTPDML